MSARQTGTGTHWNKKETSTSEKKYQDYLSESMFESHD
jgi:hypothetical protein